MSSRATGAIVNPRDACTCPDGICLGVPGESEGPRVCRACMRLDLEDDCIRSDTEGCGA